MLNFKKVGSVYLSNAMTWDGWKHVSKYEIEKDVDGWILYFNSTDNSFRLVDGFKTLKQAKEKAEELWNLIPAIPTDEDEAMRNAKYE